MLVIKDLFYKSMKLSKNLPHPYVLYSKYARWLPVSNLLFSLYLPVCSYLQYYLRHPLTGPISIIQLAVLITLRLCSITTTLHYDYVGDATPSAIARYHKNLDPWGLSRIYRVLPVSGLNDFLDDSIGWFSPPNSIVEF